MAGAAVGVPFYAKGSQLVTIVRSVPIRELSDAFLVELRITLYEVHARRDFAMVHREVSESAVLRRDVMLSHLKSETHAGPR